MYYADQAGMRGRLAFTSDIGGGFDIWLYDPGYGAAMRLTYGLADEYSVPVWSPDNGKIAFIGRNRIIFIYELRSHAVSRIDQVEELPPPGLDWSTDNRTIAYVKQGRIMIYDTVSHRSTAIPQPGASNVQWFPGGGELLYEAPDESGISQLFRIRPDGSGKRQVTKNTEGPLHNVRLSPDGSYALYTTPGASISLIRTVELESSAVFEIPGGPQAKNYYPEWSIDSSSIAYSATDFREGTGYFSLIRTTGRHGENDRTVAMSDCYATPVSWSPDGKLAYLSGCQGEAYAGEIWLIDPAHPSPELLLRGGRITALQWSGRQSSSPSYQQLYTNSTYHISLQVPGPLA